jgi:ribosome biogenesis protein UTP30
MTTKLDTALTAKAIHSLFRYEEKKGSDKWKQVLVAKPILAQVQLKNKLKKSVIRPVRVKLPNSLASVDDEDHSVCLFCTNEDKKSIDDYLKVNKVEGLTKVLSINDVRNQYRKHKEGKKLLGEHTHFICDTSVLAKLYSLLGKTFADRLNCPVPVSYKSPEKIEDAMTKVISSSYMHLKGQTITIRIGLTTMSEADVTANTLEGLEFAVAKFNNTWNDVHSIHVKTMDSPAMPIYSKTPSEMLQYIKRKAEIVEEKNPLKEGKKRKAPDSNMSKVTTVVAQESEAEIMSQIVAKKRKMTSKTIRI